ncbi:MAG: ammonium transporter [Planctomycetota bacterium]|jgi:Amt family ammonium transporter
MRIALFGWIAATLLAASAFAQGHLLPVAAEASVATASPAWEYDAPALRAAVDAAAKDADGVRTASVPGHVAYTHSNGAVRRVEAWFTQTLKAGRYGEIVVVEGPHIEPAHTAWMIVATALVLLMAPGLAFFYGGLVRRKNVLSVLIQCFMSMCLMTVLWVTVGYSLAFGGSTAGGFVGDLRHALLSGVGTEAKGAIPHVLFMAFQGMFAIITPALILGAFAERMRFRGFCLFSALWLLLVYCPVCHWIWGGAEGFFGLGSDGALDFAGGTVVHINAGIAALVAALFLGRRQGYPGRISPPHNLPFAILGAGLLWFGWFGFNAGSALAADAVASNALVTTHVAAAAAGLTWSLVEWIRGGKPTALGLITGVVAGLVAVTPACGFVSPVGALGIGAGAALLAYLAVAVAKERLGYDDSLDVWGVHGIAGIWGALAAGIWAVESIGGTAGLLEGNSAQVVLQLKAVVYTLVYSGVVSYLLLRLVNATAGLKVDEHDERVGLDLTEHAETAYTVVD